MAQIGTLRIRHNNANIDVPVYQPGDVDYPFLRIWLKNQVGVLPMYPIAEEPTHTFFRVRHNNTTFALHDSAKVTLFVDDYESGNKSAYGYDGGVFSVTTGAAFQGTYGLSKTSTTSGGIYSETGLPNYPSRGTRFRIYWNAGWPTDPAIWRIYFGVTMGAGTGAGSPDWGYRLDFEPGSSGGSQIIQKRANGTTTGIPGTDTSWAPSQNTWYYTDVTWDDGTLGGANGDITARVYDAATNTLQATLGPGNDTEIASGGIGYWANGNVNQLYLDAYQLL